MLTEFVPKGGVLLNILQTDNFFSFSCVNQYLNNTESQYAPCRVVIHLASTDSLSFQHFSVHEKITSEACKPNLIFPNLDAKK